MNAGGPFLQKRQARAKRKRYLSMDYTHRMRYRRERRGLSAKRATILVEKILGLNQTAFKFEKIKSLSMVRGVPS